MIGGCAKFIVIAACLAVTGCGSSKPEKAFCKAENRVIPDDELKVLALLAMWKTGNYKSDPSNPTEMYLARLPIYGSDDEIKSELMKYINKNPRMVYFSYGPTADFHPSSENETRDFENGELYYRNLVLPNYVGHNRNENAKIKVSMCGKIIFLDFGWIG